MKFDVYFGEKLIAKITLRVSLGVNFPFFTLCDRLCISQSVSADWSL